MPESIEETVINVTIPMPIRRESVVTAAVTEKKESFAELTIGTKSVSFECDIKKEIEEKEVRKPKQAPTPVVVPGVDPILENVEKNTGLKITGGSDFNMPITIFHVKENSKAKRVGLKLGDSIVMIDGKDTSMMTLNEANEALLHATKAIRSFKLGVIRFHDDEASKVDKNDDDDDSPFVEEVVMEGNPKAPRFHIEHHVEPPHEAYVQRPERKAWHPIMWPHPEYFLPENYHEELPHKRVIRNVRKMLESKPSKIELESLFTALPRGSRPKRNYDDDSD